MCIRDRAHKDREDEGRPEHRDDVLRPEPYRLAPREPLVRSCLLYTSDAADERSSVDLGGRRIIKKKKRSEHRGGERSKQHRDTNRVN